MQKSEKHEENKEKCRTWRKMKNSEEESRKLKKSKGNEDK